MSTTEEEMQTQIATNPFIADPFQPLTIDPGRFVSDIAFRTLFLIVNALNFFQGKCLANRKDLIDLGVRKGENYDVLNKKKYDAEASIAALESKKSAIEELLRYKRHEMKSFLGGGADRI